MTTLFSSTSFFEQLSTLPILQAKNNLEVCIMQIAHWLELSEETWSDRTRTAEELFKTYKTQRLAAPDGVGRIICRASRETPAQIPHYEFSFSTKNELSPNGSLRHPLYFCMVTGKKYAPLWVLEGSHFFVGVKYETMKELGKVHQLRLIYVPPNSILVARGDLLHALAGGEESFGDKATRFHRYVMRAGVALADTINEIVGRFFSNEDRDL